MLDKILSIIYINENINDEVYTEDGFNTKYGIVFEKHQDWLAEKKCYSAEDITVYIRDIFYMQKANKMNIDMINSFDLAYNVFDMGINSGQKTSGELLQECINRFNVITKLKVDGIIGAKTIRALNYVFSCYEKESIIDMFIEARQAKYFRILAHKRENEEFSDKKLMDFLESWRRRSRRVSK
jgi:lysozyme family protein